MHANGPLACFMGTAALVSIFLFTVGPGRKGRAFVKNIDASEKLRSGKSSVTFPNKYLFWMGEGHKSPRLQAALMC